MEERRSIEGNEQPRFAHVISGESHQERPQLLREVRPLAEHVSRHLRKRHHDKVEVGVFVEHAAAKRTAGG